MNSTNAPYRRIHRLRTPVVLLALSLCALVTLPATAQPMQREVESLINKANLPGVKIGVMLIDLSSHKTLAQVRRDEPMIPASNLKIVTSAAALSKLGDGFTFSTQLRTDGKSLYVIGDGDPGFGDAALLAPLGMNVNDLVDRWVQTIGKMNLKQFDGLVIDDRVFDDDHVHPHWPENQLHKWYCAQVAGLTFNDNCVDLMVEPTKPGAPANVQVRPSDMPIEFECDVKTGSKHLPVIGRHLGGNRIIFSGTVSVTPDEPYYVTVHDPPMVFAGLLQKRLSAAGIEVKSIRRAAFDEQLPEGHLLAEVRTPIQSVLARCNKDSQNLFAECLVKRLGHAATGQPGSWSNGTNAATSFLESIGVDTDNLTLDDGSGMSRYNRVTPATLAMVLAHMYRADGSIATTYVTSLARPGEPGTLEHRFNDADLHGEVYGKSGYISGVYALSGYVINGDRAVAFSCLVNNFRPPSNGRYVTPKALFEQIVEAADDYLAKQIAERN
ncbi:MAG: D-alanyl-D-alanine carboxypeptidase/D-alanyl-D-alanine-endopeptidase [Phycisphaera sp.]|nr:D-alanyl-D-alanine carboxypeptidase/D-alanyl-D-alanine-endopeptidase [Phycisphaera sp.]